MPIQEGPRLSNYAAPSTPSRGTENGEQTAEPISWGPGYGRRVYAGATWPLHQVPSLEEVQPRQPWGGPRRPGAALGGAWAGTGCITLGT